MPLSDVGKKTVAAAQLVEKSIASSESKFMTVLNKMAAEMKKMSSKLQATTGTEMSSSEAFETRIQQLQQELRIIEKQSFQERQNVSPSCPPPLPPPFTPPLYTPPPDPPPPLSSSPRSRPATTSSRRLAAR